MMNACEPHDWIRFPHVTPHGTINTKHAYHIINYSPIILNAMYHLFVVTGTD